MLKKTLLSLILAALALSGAAFADDTPKGNVHPYIKLSASERFRFVSWDNSTTLDDARDGANTFTRHHTSVTGQFYPHDDVEFCLKLTNEFRYYFTPGDTDFEINEIFFDQLYARYTGRFINLTLGRQNLMFGEGLILFDGGPLDGSRSAYFNAARLDVKPCSKGMITLFYFFQPEQEDYLPLVNDQENALIEQDEQGFGVYLNRDFDKVNLQAYYLRKNRKDEIADLYAYEFNTLGIRLGFDITPQLAFAGEYASQTGEWDFLYDQSAYAGYAHLDYKTGWKEFLPTNLTLGFVYLSGDNPRTSNHEGWEPLFGRWPKYSESYIYTLLIEGNGIAYWSDYYSINARAGFALTDKVNFRAEYQSLHATRYPSMRIPWHAIRGLGKNRGNMFIGKVNFTINEYLSGHALWEHFRPGSFYSEEADPANWLRVQLMLNVS